MNPVVFTLFRVFCHVVLGLLTLLGVGYQLLICALSIPFPQFLVVLGFLPLMLFGPTFVHQFGQVIASWWAKLTVMQVSAYGLSLHRADLASPWRLRLTPPPYTGRVVVSMAQDGTALFRRHLTYALGGVTLQFLFAILCLVLGQMLFSPEDGRIKFTREFRNHVAINFPNTPWIAVLNLLVLANVASALRVLVPSKPGAPASVGSRLLALLFQPHVERMLALVYLQCWTAFGVRPRDWSLELVARLDSPGPPETDLTANLYQYYFHEDRGELEPAERHLHRAIELVEPSQPVPSVLAAGAAYVAGFHHRDGAKAREWLSKVKSAEADPQTRACAEAAALFAEQQYPQAIAVAKQGIEASKQALNVGGAKAERDWLQAIIAACPPVETSDPPQHRNVAPQTPTTTTDTRWQQVVYFLLWMVRVPWIGTVAGLTLYYQLVQCWFALTNPQFLLVCCLLVPALFCTAPVGEFGNVVGAWLARLTVTEVSVFGLTLVRTDASSPRWHCRMRSLFSPPSTSALAWDGKALRRRHLTIGLGDVTMQFLVAILCLGIGQWIYSHLPGTDGVRGSFLGQIAFLFPNTPLVAALNLFAIAHVAFGLSSLVLTAPGTPPSAGTQILALIREPQVERAIALTYLQGWLLLGVRPRGWGPDLVAKLHDPGSAQTEFLAATYLYYYHEDWGEAAVAERHLLRAIDLVDKLHPMASALAAEAAYVAGFHHRDAAKAREWLSKVKLAEVEEQTRARAEAAALFAEQQYPQAILRAEQGIEVSRRSVDKGGSTAERDWLQAIIDACRVVGDGEPVAEPPSPTRLL